MIYITSDLHFGHSKEFLYVPRGFNTIEEHDKQVIENWNKLIKDEDTVYVLGDLIMSDKQNGYDCLKQLKGNIKYIIGNHDTTNKILNIYNSLGLTMLGYADVIKYGKYRFYLSHYPTLVSNIDDKGLKKSTINLCGHTHTNDKFKDWDKGLIYHCELDAHNNTPVNIETIIEEVKEKYETDKE